MQSKKKENCNAENTRVGLILPSYAIDNMIIEYSEKAWQRKNLMESLLNQSSRDIGMLIIVYSEKKKVDKNRKSRIVFIPSHGSQHPYSQGSCLQTKKTNEKKISIGHIYGWILPTRSTLSTTGLTQELGGNCLEIRFTYLKYRFEPSLTEERKISERTRAPTQLLVKIFFVSVFHLTLKALSLKHVYT